MIFINFKNNNNTLTTCLLAYYIFELKQLYLRRTFYKTMRKQRNPYQFLRTYCLRTPLLALNILDDVFGNRRIDKKALRTYWNDSVIKEALFLASADLHQQLNLLFLDRIENTKKEERLVHSFLKYLLRASTRCTPFGLFAGISIGTFDTHTAIHIATINNHRRITQLDSNYIASLSKHLSNNAVIKKQLLFYPNTSLYRLGEQFRYIEYQLTDNKRSYSLEAVQNNDYLSLLLSLSKNGATINQLAKNLVNKEISLEDATAYIQLLISNQILVSSLELNVTGDDMLSCILNVLSKLHHTENMVARLKHLQNQLENLDKRLGNTPKNYKNILETLKKIHVPFESKNLFQTDLKICAPTNTLNQKHGYTLLKLVPLLNKLTPYIPNKNLENFKKAFTKRYEQQEVPLMQLLDIESGIGYIQQSTISDTTPFLEDIRPRHKNDFEINTTYTYSKSDEIINNKLIKTLKNKEYILELIDADFEELASDWKYGSDTLSAFVEIVYINNVETLSVKGIYEGAGNLIARFGHLDTHLLKHIQDITDKEQQMNPNSLLTEIVHLPEDRTGNILKRPHIRSYEIPYLATSNLPKSQQVDLKDIVVSIKNNHVVLRSTILNKIITPKLTNAHNFTSNSLPVYQFLCDLQSQNTKQQLGFNWHPSVKKYSFLPRVHYKNTILSKARWYISLENIQLFMKYAKNDHKLLAQINRWKTSNGAPKLLVLIEGDNTLLIHLENLESIKLFLNIIKRKKFCILEEYLFEDKVVVNSNNKRFTNECIIALYNQQKLKL